MKRYKGLDLSEGAYTLEELIDSWLSCCVNTSWKKRLEERGIDKDEVIEVIKQKAFSARKRGEFNFQFIYKIESEVLDLLRLDYKIYMSDIQKEGANEIIEPEVGTKFKKEKYHISFEFNGSKITFTKPKDAISWYQQKFNLDYSVAKNRIYNSLKRESKTPDNIFCKKIVVKR